MFTTTGTGWVDERAASPLEYMYNGDTALVALQYSYLPSWISFLVDVEKAADAGREMIHAVQGRLADDARRRRDRSCCSSARASARTAPSRRSTTSTR